MPIPLLSQQRSSGWSPRHMASGRSAWSSIPPAMGPRLLCRRRPRARGIPAPHRLRGPLASGGSGGRVRAFANAPTDPALRGGQAGFATVIGLMWQTVHANSGNTLHSLTLVWVVTKSEVRWVRSEMGKEALKHEVAALRSGPQHLTRPPLAHLVHRASVSHGLPSSSGRHHFRLLMSFKMAMSSIVGQ